MAYQFDSTLNALRGGQGQQPDQANIFAQQPAASGADQNGQAAGQVQATDSGGDLSGASGGGAAPQAAAPVTGSAAQSQVFAANRGKTQAPVDLGKIQGQVDTASTALQNEADTYTKNASAQYATPANDYAAVDQYVEGGAPAGDWATNYTKNNAGLVDHFTPTTDTSFVDNDAKLLGNDAGVRELLRRQGDPEYNQNDAGFDAALLRQDAGFNHTRDALVNSAQALRDKASSIGSTAETNAQTGLNDAYTGWRADIGKHLGADRDALIGQRADEASAANRGVAGLEMNNAIHPDQAARDANVTALVNEERANPNYAANSSYIGTDGIDTAKYFKPAADPGLATAQDFYTPDDIAKFGRVENILKSGGSTPVAAGRYVGKSAKDIVGPETFDKNGLGQALLDSAQKKHDTKNAADAKFTANQAAVAAAKAAADAKAKDDADRAAAAAAKPYDVQTTGDTHGSTPENAIFKAGGDVADKAKQSEPAQIVKNADPRKLKGRPY